MPTRVLFSTNGAEPAAAAGALLRSFADPDKVEVTVNVCESVEFAFPKEPWKYGGEWIPRAQPRQVAEDVAAEFRSAGFSAETVVGHGVPAAQVLEQLHAAEYGLVALGAGSTRWLDNVLLGSTSTRILHSSPTSVLVVHRFSGREGPVRVVLASDGSADAAVSLETFTSIADVKKTAVTVVSVADVVPSVSPLVPGARPPSDVVGYLEQQARANAEAAARMLADEGFQVDVETPAGEPVSVLLRLSNEADLVVCGSRGLGGPSRLLLGSVSDQLARLAPAAMVCRRSRTGG
ncbi:MAG TPA: universal stress protein [Actinomycetota bacterium]|nr:universal stress protein [Actinomycetota bacterium]